jgi:hypothetical protein
MDRNFGLGAPEWGILCTGVLIGLVITVCFLMTLNNALLRVSPQNRLMEPGMVWLLLIPCFNLIWNFFVFTRVPDSLRNEFRERHADDGSNYAKSAGVTLAVLDIVLPLINGGQVAMGAARIATCVSGILGIVSLFVFIVFWIRIGSYSSRLAALSGPPPDWRRKLDAFDDDDDRGRPPRTGQLPPPDSYKEGDPGQYQ